MTEKYYLFLDDVRDPNDVTWVKLPPYEWTVVRNYNEFCDVIYNKGIPEFVCYDHDLAQSHYSDMNHGGDIDYDSSKEKTGYDCAKFLANECAKLKIDHPPYVVHSLNPIGAENIDNYIKLFNKWNRKFDFFIKKPNVDTNDTKC